MKRGITRKVLLAKTRTQKRGRRGNPLLTHIKSDTLYQIALAKKGKAKVCIIRKVGGIGDVLMVTPSLRQLREDFEDLDLTFAIDMHTTGNNVYYELMKNCPFVTKLIDARYVNHGEYDAVIDVSAVCLRYEREDLPAINRIDLFARAIGIRFIQDKCSWYLVEESERQWAQQVSKRHRQSGKRLVALHTASMEGKRCWPIEKYIQIVERAEQENLPVQFIILDFNNKYNNWNKHTNCSNWSHTNVRQMTALIAEADLFIGPDSGPMHLAGAVGTKSIVTFGSVPPNARINYYPTHQAVVLSGLSCLGCWYKQCPYDIKCMKDLNADLVYQKIKFQLEL